MKKIYLIATAAVLSFAACSSDDAVITGQEEAQGDVPVLFGAYVNRSVTRAGLPGMINDVAALKTNGGFGIFACYTDNEVYSETATPNFMYNQLVTGAGSSAPYTWTYEPVKYWPNEFGKNASSERVDYLSFFAYAPHVTVTPQTGMITPTITSDATGIIGLSRNTAIGDPLVKYAVDFTPANCVDLLWGTNGASAFTSTVNSETPNNVPANAPYKDVSKPEISSKITFQFHHALASLNVQVDAYVDGTDATKVLDANTRIYVRSVTFEGFSVKGALNLNSNYDADKSPIWYDALGSGELSTLPVSVFDGRRDGREGVGTASADNEKPKGLNPALVQVAPYAWSGVAYASTLTTTDHNGVTNTLQNLFAGATADAPIFVIPNGQPMKVTIVYDVETPDKKLATFLSDGVTKGSVIENAITKDITPAMTMVAGKKYTVKLHLGMTSVKVDAAVTDWNDGDPGDADLPINN